MCDVFCVLVVCVFVESVMVLVDGMVMFVVLWLLVLEVLFIDFYCVYDVWWGNVL